MTLEQLAESWKAFESGCLCSSRCEAHHFLFVLLLRIANVMHISTLFDEVCKSSKQKAINIQRFMNHQNQNTSQKCSGPFRIDSYGKLTEYMTYCCKWQADKTKILVLQFSPKSTVTERIKNCTGYLFNLKKFNLLSLYTRRFIVQLRVILLTSVFRFCIALNPTRTHLKSAFSGHPCVLTL